MYAAANNADERGLPIPQPPAPEHTDGWRNVDTTQRSRYTYPSDALRSRAHCEGDLDGLPLAVSQDDDRHRLAGTSRVHGALQRRGGGHCLAVELDDHVSTDRHLPAFDGLRAGRSTEIGLVCRRVGHDLGDRDAILDGRHTHAEIRVQDLAGRDELPDDGAHRVRRNGESDPVRAARLALDLRVDPDHPTPVVEERTARVAMVDRGVGLNRVDDLEVVWSGHLTVKGADDSARDRPLEPEGAPTGEDRIANVDGARVGERQRRQQPGGSVDPKYGEIGGRIRSDQLR